MASESEFTEQIASPETRPGDFSRAKEAARLILANSEHVLDPDHAENTLHWLRILKPDASEVLQLAAYMHDIERGLTDRVREEMFGSYEEYKEAHAKGGGAAAERVALSSGYSAEEAQRIGALIEAAEFSSDDPDVQLICDADSISFFDFVIWDYVTKREPEAITKKIHFMLDRASDSAKKLIQEIAGENPDLQALLAAADR